MKILRDNIYHEKRIEQVSFKLNHKKEVIEDALNYMYEYIKLKLETVEIDDEDTIMTKEEFDEKFPTIHIPSLGYLQPSYGKYLHIMKNVQKRNGNKTNE